RGAEKGSDRLRLRDVFVESLLGRTLTAALYPVSLDGGVGTGRVLMDQGPIAIQSPLVLSMDGRYALRRFFKLVPAPRDAGEGILIQRRFQALVPEAWKGSAQYYRYLYSPKRFRGAGESVLICGMYFPGWSSISHEVRKLESISKMLRRFSSPI